jgi:hypothetical protein
MGLRMLGRQRYNRGISLLPTTYKILSNILLSRLIPYAEEVIGDHQCGFLYDEYEDYWAEFPCFFYLLFV